MRLIFALLLLVSFGAAAQPLERVGRATDTFTVREIRWLPDMERTRLVLLPNGDELRAMVWYVKMDMVAAGFKDRILVAIHGTQPTNKGKLYIRFKGELWQLIRQLPEVR